MSRKNHEKIIKESQDSGDFFNVGVINKFYDEFCEMGRRTPHTSGRNVFSFITSLRNLTW